MKVVTGMYACLTRGRVGVLSVSRAVIRKCFGVVVVISITGLGGSFGRIYSRVSTLNGRVNMAVRYRERRVFRGVRHLWAIKSGTEVEL